jgi:hypothetical protein
MVARRGPFPAIGLSQLSVSVIAMAISELPSELDWEICDLARLTRDPADHGLFFTGVRATRI